VVGQQSGQGITSSSSELMVEVNERLGSAKEEGVSCLCKVRGT
jgi:hypothetical protein